MIERSLFTVVIDRKVPCVMNDGTTLYADVYRPGQPGKFPVIVERVAYELNARLSPYADWYASRGYVFVGQNTRGTYWSEGEFNPLADDGWGVNRDGYETIEWAAAQPWSNGNVGTMDGSWSGWTQNLLAPTRPPHLRAMFLRMAPSGKIGADGGVGNLGMRLFWITQMLTQARHPSAGEKLRARIPDLEKALADMRGTLEHLPASDLPIVGDLAPNVAARARLTPHDRRHRDLDATSHVSEIDVPALHMGGWFDGQLTHTLAMFTGIRASGRTEHARRSQRLLIGPWVHGPMEPDNSQQGDMDFGPEASLGINTFRLKWFDFWLKGVQNGTPDLPLARLFIMGKNRWQDFDRWPPPGVVSTKLYLWPALPEAKTVHGGRLDFNLPQVADASTSYMYDPSDPVPRHRVSEGFRSDGPIDLSSVEGRKIVFTTSPLDRPLTVVGPITARIFAKSTARDTDWFVSLTDVWPDGRSMRVQEGALRARYREGFDREVLMEPGRPYSFEIDMHATAQVFAAGHRIRLAVTSSQFPPRERNMNTGGRNGEETMRVVARNTILHDREHPSCVVLSILN